MVGAAVQLSLAPYSPWNDGTSILQELVAYEVSIGSMAGHRSSGALRSCGVSVAMGLEPLLQPDCPNSTMYIVGPARLDQVMLLAVVLIGDQVLPPLME